MAKIWHLCTIIVGWFLCPHEFVRRHEGGRIVWQCVHCLKAAPGLADPARPVAKGTTWAEEPWRVRAKAKRRKVA